MESDMERLYSPSRWSKRFERSEDVERDHVTFSENESLRMREMWPPKTIWFGSKKPHESFDIYGSHLGNNSPIFVFIHGGYWQILNKMCSSYCVGPLVQSGYKVAIMDFELCPKVSLREQIDQSYRAATAILEYSIANGASGVNFAGHSSGAHLLANITHRLIVEQSAYAVLIHFIYLISGVFDLSEVHLTNVANPNNILQITETDVNAFSPIFFDFSMWTNHGIIIRVFVAEFDSPKFIDQSKELYQRICLSVDNHLKCTFHIISRHDHFNIVSNLSNADFEITKIILLDVGL